MPDRSIALLALPGSEAQGARIADRLGVELVPMQDRLYESGERALRPCGSLRGRDAYLVGSLHGDAHRSVHDRLCMLLFLIATVRDAGADRITAIAPYLCYARKDRRTEPGDPVTSRYVAQLLEAVGLDRIVAFDVHNLAAYQNAFRCPAEQLEARPLFVRHLAGTIGPDEVTVLSPDVGGMKRAEVFRRDLQQVLGREVGLGFVEKRRDGDRIATSALIGEVAGRTVVIVDDMISTGATIREAASRCRRLGARSVLAAATHGLLAAGSEAVLADPMLDRILLTDTIDPLPLPSTLPAGRVEVVPIAGMIGDAIEELNAGTTADGPLSSPSISGHR